MPQGIKLAMARGISQSRYWRYSWKKTSGHLHLIWLVHTTEEIWPKSFAWRQRTKLLITIFPGQEGNTVFSRKENVPKVCAICDSFFGLFKPIWNKNRQSARLFSCFLSIVSLLIDQKIDQSCQWTDLMPSVDKRPITLTLKMTTALFVENQSPDSR